MFWEGIKSFSEVQTYYSHNVSYICKIYPIACIYKISQCILYLYPKTVFLLKITERDQVCLVSVNYWKTHLHFVPISTTVHLYLFFQGLIHLFCALLCTNQHTIYLLICSRKWQHRGLSSRAKCQEMPFEADIRLFQATM